MRCEARLGAVALFMPTKPEGDYKLDLRAFADRQIVILLLGGYTLYRIIRTHESVTGCSNQMDTPRCPTKNCRSLSVYVYHRVPVHDTRTILHFEK